ncbi:MAG: RNA polymerase sigma factor [Anaerohalosphaera sp.]|nr:RNA polymerase sigma factor [Anaerohalosphaera sp.]
MEEHPELKKLVKQAIAGERQSLDELARIVEPRLQSYFYRTLLDKELTDDLVQEVLLEMVKSLCKLVKPDSFWPWLFKVASNKLKHFYRISRKHSELRFSTIGDYLLDTILNEGAETADSGMIKREICDMIFDVMGHLSVRHRSVVNLRCFEDMSFAEISKAVGCSETVARVSFFNAKHKLRKEMNRRGMSKESLLMVLILFGKLTAPSRAAASTLTVSANAVGAAGIASIVKSNIGKISTSAAVLAVCIFGLSYSAMKMPGRDDVSSVSFTVQGIGPASTLSSSSESIDKSGPNFVSKGAYDTLLHFPEGVDGPMLRRDQRWLNLDRTGKACSWLQDGNANYYYGSVENIVYTTNEPLSVLVLPTDEPEFAEFLLSQCDMPDGLDYYRDPKTGLMTKCVDNRVSSVVDFKTTYRYNSLKRKAFAYDWDETVEIVDDRDQMHKRGWTWFRIQGVIGDKKVEGRGRTPFAYSAMTEHRPWLELKIGNDITILDTVDGSYVLDGSGQVIGKYPSGSFFAGLAKPWMGMRAYDVVRRDAARKRIEFDCRSSMSRGQVVLIESRDYSHTSVTCNIDMVKGIVDRIILKSMGGAKNVTGNLAFSYLQEIELSDSEFKEPDEINSDMPVSDDIGIGWLMCLAEENYDLNEGVKVVAFNNR